MYHSNHFGMLLKWAFSFTVIVFGFLTVSNAYVLLTTKKDIVLSIDKLEPSQTVLVLGAGVYANGQLSPILKDRVDTALLIYKAGKVNRILVSGDNSSFTYNEVVPVREYLLQQGVPPSHIFLDYAGFNTYDSMYRARDIFGVDSAIVVTQEFHIPRATYIADSLGIQVQGYPSAITEIYFSNHIREVFARTKSVLEVISQRKPKFLGETFPIEGDGRETLE